MNRREFVSAAAAGAITLAGSPDSLAAGTPTSARVRDARKILIAGGGFNEPFIRHMAELTGKTNPRICYLPTASADSPSGILRWYEMCAELPVTPFVQESFISSYRQQQTFADVLLSMDGIVASGGNTLNQQVIWKAHGIDEVLKQAWDQGIVLGGASAGSLCWFEEGSTDSRPIKLSKVECLGFIKGSHAPHYDAEEQRRPSYQGLILSGEMKPGWACDNNAGIYFEGEEVSRFVASRPTARVYYVEAVGGRIKETEYVPEMIA